MEYKYETHTHTGPVSMCGRVDVKEIVRLYLDKGFSGIVLTDHYSPLTWWNHNYFAPQNNIDFYLYSYREMKKIAPSDFTVMFGMELRHYGTSNDYLIYGMDDKWLEKQGNLMAVWEKGVYEMMHKEGYLVYEAHPFRPGRTRCNTKYIDGVEIYNGKTEKKYNDKAEKWAKEKGLLAVSGSDFHKPEHTGRGGIITQKPITSNADLVSTLKSMDFQMIKTY
ncbi:MAG: PHP domain-containing protein [Eubacterium sp.]